MIDAIVTRSVRHRGWVLLIVAVLTLLALRTASSLRFDAFPDLTNVQVQVLTTSPGMGTEHVEALVTTPLERALTGAPGLVVLRSISRPGVSAITAVFTDETDLWLARQIVAERVSTARDQIPEGAGSPELSPPTTGLGEVYQFTITSDRHDRPTLYRIFQQQVSPRLRDVAGVVEVNAWGAGAPQRAIVFDPFKLAAHGLTLPEVALRVQAATGQTSGGYLPRGAEQVAVRAEANPIEADALGELVIIDGPIPVRVHDLADVRVQGALTVGLGSADGEREALFVMVQLLAGADARRVTRDVAARLREVQADLPDGVEALMIYDREKLVGNTLRTVTRSLVEGGALVVLVLLVLLGDLRAGLLVASVIPLSMIGALTGLQLLGYSGNLMSLGAIDFGLVVDGAVVIVEGLVAMQLVEGHDREQAFAARARSLARPVLFAVGVLLLVYLPILALGGTEGRLFRPMALTVLLALATALVLSLTYVPAVATMILRPSGSHVPRVVRLMQRPYGWLVRAAVRRPGLPVSGALLVVVTSALLGSQLGVAFVPRLEEGDLVLQTERLPSISPDEALAGNLRVERALRAFPEVERVATRTGSPAVATDPMGLGESDVLIRLAPKSTWTTAPDLEGLVEAMSRAVHDADPAAALNFSQPIEMRFNELLEGIPSDVGIELYGDDLDALLRLGREIAAAVSALPGAADVRAPTVAGIEVANVRVDPARSGALGVQAEQVLALVEAAQRGRVAGRVLVGAFQDEVVLRLALPADVPLDDLPVVLPGGRAVPLSEVAQIQRTEMAAVIRHQAGVRRVVVQANVRGRDLGGFVSDARVAVASIARPPGTWVRWSGNYEQLQAALAQTALVVPLVLIAIFSLLVAAFGGARPAWLIFLNVPLAVSGGVFALLFAGLPISMSAIIGFIALFGISVMNGIVLVSRVLELLPERGPRDAAILGATERFRPVLTTATVAGLGFVPMALAHGVGAEVQRPLALVVIGGLLTSTALTLVVLPSLCARALPDPRPDAARGAQP